MGGEESGANPHDRYDFAAHPWEGGGMGEDGWRSPFSRICGAFSGPDELSMGYPFPPPPPSPLFRGFAELARRPQRACYTCYATRQRGPPSHRALGMWAAHEGAAAVGARAMPTGATGVGVWAAHGGAAAGLPCIAVGGAPGVGPQAMPGVPPRVGDVGRPRGRRGGTGAWAVAVVLTVP